MNKKICVKCNINKPISDFGRHSAYKDGYNSSCKLCKHLRRKEVAKQRGYWTEPVKARADAQKWRDNNREHYRKKSIDKYYKNHDRILTKNRERHHKLRDAAILAYGGYKCNCLGGCNITEPQFLAIDHMNGNGNKHRKEVVGNHMYGWLKKNNYPEGFQVLCHNCNMAKGFYKSCPHEVNLVSID